MIKLRLTYYTLTARKSVTFNMYPDIECITNPSGLFPIKGKDIIRAYKDRVAKGESTDWFYIFDEQGGEYLLEEV